MTTSVARNAHLLWAWMNERHRIYHRRMELKQEWPWTDDPILREYAFCNVFRELDRVTIWIKEHWRIPNDKHENLWFAMCVARLINWPDTLLRIGYPRALDNDDMRDWMRHAVTTMHRMQTDGLKVYTGAYMLRGDIQGGLADKASYTMYKILWPLWLARGVFDANMEPTEMTEPTLYSTWAWLTEFHGMGGFLAYEVVTDLRWTRYLSNAPDKMLWANAGPGAIRGLKRLLNGGSLETKVSLDQTMANHLMMELCELANTPGKGVDPLLYSWAGPGTYTPIEMRDIEHSLCELDKYLRTKEGSGRPRSRYKPPASAPRSP